MKLLGIIKPFGFKFVGDGQLVIDGKLPDFWDGGNKLIELYGDYWHKDDNPQDRINIFKSHDYDCLIVWEHELKDMDVLKVKITNFFMDEV